MEVTHHLETPVTSTGLLRDVSPLLRRPLIAGASVSADHSTLSPAKRLAYRCTPPSEVRTLAVGGRPGAEMAPRLTETVLRDRSILLGIDLFFWDSTLHSIDASLKALHDLMERAKKLHLPVVLGDIPALLPAMQPHRLTLNQAIRELSDKHPRCGVLSFDEIHREVMLAGGLHYRGRKLELWELIPDGLHLSEHASEYLVDRLRDAIPD